MSLLLAIWLLGTNLSPVQAQYNFYFEDLVYAENIKSVKLEIKGSPMSKPLVFLDSKIKLELQFDDLGLDDYDYMYDIIHCDHNWNPSNLDNIEYLDGFTGEVIEEVDYSINTIVDYAHYSLSLPNDDLKWTLSGNYLLAVYQDDDNKTPIITRRFMVLEGSVLIDQQLTNPIDAKKYDTHHEIDFSINIKDKNLQDPQSNVFATILQNFRWDNAIENISPRYLSGDELVFDYSNKLLFPALKEYRYFDTRTLLSTGYNIQSIDLYNESTDVLVELQRKRTNRSFQSRVDANGQFVCYTEEKRDELLSADYTNVIFGLESVDLGKDIYILGKFNDYIADESSLLNYDEKHGAYFIQLLLKQGYYDYMFGTAVEEHLDIAAIEGSSYETENEYTIFIYYYSRYLDYDQLIGFKNFNSGKQF